MFGHQHYVPVLRAKPAELRALRTLDSVARSRITPLLECPPRVLRGCETLARLEGRVRHIAAHLANWTGRSVFIDFDMLRSTHPQVVEMMAERLVSFNIRPVIVISLKTGWQSAYGRSVRAALSRHDAGVCLRVSPEELKLSAIHELIERCLTAHGVQPTVVDLIIDRGGVDGGSVTYQEFAHHIPCITSWRTLTVLAGSFPEDLSRLAPGRTHRLQRIEWQQWQSLRLWPDRRPAFGDYAIQHVVFKEPVAVPNFSASVRYTIEDQYFVLRGEGVLNEGGPGYAQWNAWAVLLRDRPEFFGDEFSAGDRYIAERAADWRSTGSAQSWLQAGFSHHLTTTALQVAGRLEEVRRPASVSKAAVPAWAADSDTHQPDVTR